MSEEINGLTGLVEDNSKSVKKGTLVDIIKFKLSGLKKTAKESLPKSMVDALKEYGNNAITYWDYGRNDFFTNVAIETTSICNRVCGYCPNADEDLKSKRPQKSMDNDTYEKIISNLAEIEYKGNISFQHYGEPLLDSILEEKVKLAREKLPTAHLSIATNGDYLTPKRFETLIEAGIDSILVTNHNLNGKYSKTVQELKVYLDTNPKKKEHIKIRNGIEQYSNRGGLIEVPENKKAKDMTRCIDESHTLNIDVEGNVVLCSGDYLGKYRFGNVNQESITNIWDNPKFKTIRHEKKQGTYNLDMCKICAEQQVPK